MFTSWCPSASVRRPNAEPLRGEGFWLQRLMGDVATCANFGGNRVNPIPRRGYLNSIPNLRAIFVFERITGYAKLISKPILNFRMADNPGGIEKSDPVPAADAEVALPPLVVSAVAKFNFSVPESPAKFSFARPRPVSSVLTVGMHQGGGLLTSPKWKRRPEGRSRMLTTVGSAVLLIRASEVGIVE